MSRRFLAVVMVVAALALSSACERRMDLVIYNACKGSWVTVVDGRGRELVRQLGYGQEAAVDVRGYSGTTIYLLATGYSLDGNRPLGSATDSRHIPRIYGSSPTGPSQLQPWRITSLQSTDRNGGCQR